MATITPSLIRSDATGSPTVRSRCGGGGGCGEADPLHAVRVPVLPDQAYAKGSDQQQLQPRTSGSLALRPSSHAHAHHPCAHSTRRRFRDPKLTSDTRLAKAAKTAYLPTVPAGPRLQSRDSCLTPVTHLSPSPAARRRPPCHPLRHQALAVSMLSLFIYRVWSRSALSPRLPCSVPVSFGLSVCVLRRPVLVDPIRPSSLSRLSFPLLVNPFFSPSLRFSPLPFFPPSLSLLSFAFP